VGNPSSACERNEVFFQSRFAAKSAVCSSGRLGFPFLPSRANNQGGSPHWESMLVTRAPSSFPSATNINGLIGLRATIGNPRESGPVWNKDLPRL
jgi:hypothetical protein